MREVCILFSFILFPILVHSQKIREDKIYKTTYLLTYKSDSTRIQSQREEEFWLFFNEENSQFLSRKKALEDSIAQNFNVGDIGSSRWQNAVAQSKTDFHFEIKKDRTSNLIYFQEKVFKDIFYYTQTLDLFKWEIDTLTSTISGYPVQKATTSFAGRDYIAWFTSEIPVPDGPYKFSGLPGLILKIQDTNKDFVFNFQSFEEIKTEHVFNIPAKKAQQTTKKELLRLISDYQKDEIKYINNNASTGRVKVQINMKGNEKRKFLKKKKQNRSKMKSIEIE